jgi:hypothetical protein
MDLGVRVAVEMLVWQGVDELSAISRSIACQ